MDLSEFQELLQEIADGRYEEDYPGQTAEHRRQRTVEEAVRAADAIMESIRRDYGIQYTPQQAMVISEEIYFFVDFWLPSLRIAIEIDGEEHFRKSNRAQHKWRQQLIRHKRIKFIRFTNAEVRSSPKEVRARILYFAVSVGDKHGKKFLLRQIEALRNEGILKENAFAKHLKKASLSDRAEPLQ